MLPHQQVPLAGCMFPRCTDACQAECLASRPCPAPALLSPGSKSTSLLDTYGVQSTFPVRKLVSWHVRSRPVTVVSPPVCSASMRLAEASVLSMPQTSDPTFKLLDKQCVKEGVTPTDSEPAVHYWTPCLS